MKKIALVFISFFTISTLLFAQKDKLKTIELANGQATIELPVSFKLPVEIPVIVKDSSSTSKHYIFINRKNEEVILTYEYPEGNNYVRITDNEVTEWADKQLTLLKKSNLFKYVDDGVYLQNWKNISYIKYTTKQQKTGDTFNMLFFTNMGDKLIQFQFSCPFKIRKKWEPVADSIANSLRIKESE